ncbi:MAG: tetratricopeptide repeat protein [Gemmatimonadetes bacterium]|nr:tetratricopeptide repeat protein [Gemmatimonadota bacterium]
MAIRRARGETPRVREREYDNDALSLDAVLVRPTSLLPAGTFASFHAYPYYPDFMLLEDGYQDAASSFGRSNYFAYLSALKAHHGDVPVVISEYGVPASLGTGHLQPQGWHHGGTPERSVAETNRRLTMELAEAGLAGGILFAWIDEWFKHNWVTLEFELPADRSRLWYNRLNAEQHYGVMALEAEPAVAGRTLSERLSTWRGVAPLYDQPGLTVRAAQDGAYLWLLVDGVDPAGLDTTFVGFDVVDERAGDFRWPGRVGERLPVGVEFVLQATGSEVRVVADPGSNPFRLVEVGSGAADLEGLRLDIADPPLGLFHARVEQRFNFPWYTTPNEDGRYDSLRVVVNRRRFARDSSEFLGIGYDRGWLHRGNAPDGFWERSGAALEVRIPWMLIGVTDPSSRTVLQGPGVANARGAELGSDGVWRLRAGVAAWPDSVFGELGTRQIESIGVVVGVMRRGAWVQASRASEAVARFGWPTWEVPAWTERLRPTYGVGATRATTEERRSPGPSVLEVDAQVDPAHEAWVNGDTELALRLYEERLARDPDDGVALHRVALMRAWAGEYDVATAHFDHLLEVEPANTDARVDRARVWAWAGETDRALDALAEVLDQNPTHPGALEARALFEAWAGRYDAALTSYDALLAIAPDNGAARRQQAQVLTWASRFEVSRVVYDSLLARDPDDVESRLGLANALTFSDSLDAAVAEYDRILAARPDDVRALQGKGRALGWANRLIDAEAVYRRAVSVDSENVASLVGLAQILRWQDRNAAALDVLRSAERIAPTNGDVREQLRGIDMALSPALRPSFVWEDDSDGNVMLTTAISATVRPAPRLELRADTYRRGLSFGTLERSAMGVSFAASYQLDPGWTLTAGAGGSDSEGGGSVTAYLVGVRSPARHHAAASISFASSALDVTAPLANRGVTTTGLSIDTRWTPSPRWRVDASVGRTRFQGTQANDRTNGSVALGRQLGRQLNLGASLRAFSFEQDLTEGYFDPDFYGIAELPARWMGETGAWTLVAEVAPGLQKVTADGDLAAAFRGSVRAAYRVGAGRELSVGWGYSSTGLQSFSTGASDYRYTALVTGASWVF